MYWPAGLKTKMTVLANVYDAFMSMKSAPKLVPWAEANPVLADITTSVIKLRREKKRGH